jgi:hypothetical protein
MKKIIQTALATLVALGFAGTLSSCGGDTATPAASSLKTYDGGDFTLSIDPTWKIINSSDFYSEIPKETVVAFTTPEAYNGFFINVNVVKENLSQAVSSVDYGRANINLSGQTLTDYQKLQEATVTVSGKPALLHLFQARLNPTEKLMKFVQLYATKGNVGYIVSGGMLPDTPKETRDLVGATVTSFNLK